LRPKVARLARDAQDPARARARFRPCDHRRLAPTCGCVPRGETRADSHRPPRAFRGRVRARRAPRRWRVVVRLSSKRPIPSVPLYPRYCEFKRGGRYRAQKARIELGKQYERAPEQLAAEFARSVEAFASYDNPGEALTGRKRRCSITPTRRRSRTAAR